jgi:DNA topoisomerase I
VQSVALRLVVEREEELERFVPAEYWGLDCSVLLPSGDACSARLAHYNGRSMDKEPLRDRDEAERAAREVLGSDVAVLAARPRRVSRQPAPPFITSTLQQDAIRRLGFSAKQTMSLAQRLYEEGHITYMRTDGLNMSEEALAAIRSFVTDEYGPQFLSEAPKRYQSRAKNAQESHECIRPTDVALTPARLPAALGPQERRLYELIWRRAAGCQMAPAVTDRITLEFGDARAAAGAAAAANSSNSSSAAMTEEGSDAEDAGPAPAGTPFLLRATSSRLSFPGFLILSKEDSSGGGGSDLAEAGGALAADGEGAGAAAAAATAGGVTPSANANATPQLFAAFSALRGGERVSVPESGLSSTQHFTQPPGRFNEGSLVRTLEELGIGRPSTYASTISLLQDRGYVRKEGRTLVPESSGRVSVAFLRHFFPRYVDYNFTSNLEERLDQITAEAATRTQVLQDFWGAFQQACAEALDVPRTEVQVALDRALGPQFFPPRADGSDPRACPRCGTGRLVLLWAPRSGPFFGCPNYKKEGAGGTEGREQEGASSSSSGGGGGETSCTYIKPFTISAPPPPSADGAEGSSGSGSDSEGEGWGADLQLPRSLGRDPASGEEVWVRQGPYGLYLQMGDAPPAAEGGKKRGAPKPKRASVRIGSFFFSFLCFFLFFFYYFHETS